MTDLATGTERTVTAEIVVVGGNPDATESAAITAVVAEVLDELAAEVGRREQAGPTAWQRSQRDVRSPLHTGRGFWQDFGR